jgi:hypothetical protein
VEQLVPKASPSAASLKCVGWPAWSRFRGHRDPVVTVRHTQGPCHQRESGRRKRLDGVLPRTEPYFFEGQASSLELTDHLLQRERSDHEP